MGMFDELKVRHHSILPGPPAWLKPDATFQTKDLDCNLDLYEIDADGVLRRLRASAPEWSLVNGARPSEYTGTLPVHRGQMLDGEWVWYEVEATVERGRVVRMERVPNEE
jgi:hypothetical protein